jgi:hypothetical protein
MSNFLEKAQKLRPKQNIAMFLFFFIKLTAYSFGLISYLPAALFSQNKPATTN